MAYDKREISTGALTKHGGDIRHHTDDVTATIESAGYYNDLAVDSKVPSPGILFHFDLAGKITLYGYTHNGATLTLNTANAVSLIP